MADRNLKFDVFGLATSKGFRELSAHMTVLRQQLRQIGRTRETAHVTVDVDRRRFSDIDGNISRTTRALGVMKSGVESFGGLAISTFSKFGMAVSGSLPAVLAIGVAILAIAPALITLTGLVAGLAGGLAAMGAIAAASSGVFLIGFIPVVAKLAKAFQDGEEGIAKLPPHLRNTAREVQSLKKAFSDWLGPLEPAIAGVIDRFLQLTRSILPSLSPIVSGMARAFDGLAVKMKETLAGPVWQEFFAMLADRGPRIFTNLSDAAGHFLTGLAALLNSAAPAAERLSAKINDLAIRFENWASSVAGHRAIQNFISWVKDEAPGAIAGLKKVLGESVDFLKNLASDDIQKDLENLAAVINALATAISGLEKALSGLKKVWDWTQNPDLVPDSLLPKDKGEFKTSKRGPTDLEKEKSAVGQGLTLAPINIQPLIATMDVVKSKIASSFTAGWALARNATVGALSDILGKVSGLPGSIGAGLSSLPGIMSSAFSAAWGAARNLTASGVSQAVSLAGLAPARIVGVLSGLPGMLGGLSSHAWGSFNNAFSSGVSTAIGISGQLVGGVLGNLNSLAGRAHSAGASIGFSIAAGIRSAVREASNAASDLARAVADKFPGSPVKEGPLRVLNDGYAGGQIAKMIAAGISGGRMFASTAASNLAQTIASNVNPTLGAGSGPYGAGYRGVTIENVNLSSPVDVDILASRLGFLTAGAGL